MKDFDFIDILRILPHRYPLLLVDGVASVSAEGIVAFKNVSLNEPQFAGHFPDQPVFPAMLLVEALAQAGALLAYHAGGFDPETQSVFFLGVDQARFPAPVFPGDRVTLDVKPLRAGSSIWKLSGRASVAGEEVATARFTALIADRDHLMRKRQDRGQP